MDIAWADVLRGALSFFLVVVGIGIAYVCFRLGGVLGRMSTSVRQVTDEVVPILSRAQTTVDGINLELQRVDEIMVSAVNATKGAEKTVTSISNAVTSPVKKASGWAAAAKEAMATFRARRATGPDGTESTADSAPNPPPDPFEMHVKPAPRSQETMHASVNGTGADSADDGSGRRGPSASQISWALPKRRK